MTVALQRSKLFTAFNALQDNELEFNSLALEVYEYQKSQNPIYKRYLETIGRFHVAVGHYREIPGLPIQFFKSHDIQTSVGWEAEDVFLSSGTGGARSRHLIRDKAFYHRHALSLFEERVGAPSQYCFLGLLPGYLERVGSSLIEMVNYFITQSVYTQSGFYLDDVEALKTNLEELNREGIPTILFGVSFALLDFFENSELKIPKITIIETGGMKGTGEALSKREILNRLQTTSEALHIYSEYGMTELLSQAYALDGIHFRECKTMKVVITEINDPFHRARQGKSGQVTAIDLANIDTCAFIQTQDLGRRINDDEFEILGRMELGDLRGCNLLLEDIDL